jgi:NAD(P)-dependent dehydrogenase (short-subunit alcohol dehydrogenase family)
MEITVTGKKVWLITGAGRGIGVYIAKAALAAGNAVVATGRNAEAVTKALGDHEDLLAARLDITNRADAEAASTYYSARIACRRVSSAREVNGAGYRCDVGVSCTVSSAATTPIAAAVGRLERRSRACQLRHRRKTAR